MKFSFTNIFKTIRQLQVLESKHRQSQYKGENHNESENFPFDEDSHATLNKQQLTENNE